MARRKAKLDLTLFPFLSVLSGLIALNVVLMFVTISTRVISPEVEAPAPESSEGGDAADDAVVVPNGIDAASYEQLERLIKEQEAKLEKSRAERTELRLKMREIASLIKEKEIELDQSQVHTAPKTGERIGEPSPLRIIPAPSPDGVARKAVFIEVSSSGYIVHPEKTEIPVDLAKKTKLGFVEVPAALEKVLAAMEKSSDNRYPIFLIHPSGADAFQGARVHLKLIHPRLRSGWEPFSREYLLDPNSK